MLPQTNSTFLNAIAPPAGASSHLCFKEIPSRTMAGTGLGDVFGRSLVRGLSLRFVQNIQGGLCLGGRAIPAGAINPSGSYLALFIFAVHRHKASQF